MNTRNIKCYSYQNWRFVIVRLQCERIHWSQFNARQNVIRTALQLRYRFPKPKIGPPLTIILSSSILRIFEFERLMVVIENLQTVKALHHSPRSEFDSADSAGTKCQLIRQCHLCDTVTSSELWFRGTV